ncbi:MAG: pantoate--beta-alanine ligase [Spirochaetae bacterium HGW-Spirochaetae-8]|nr:MAG: pantoate--beta-alanine ligase [Spirochaetae bacterium HGW-Spirochaetae-8]
MKIIKTKEAWEQERGILTGKSIGMVPTMGALHAGHLSLIQCCRNQNDITVASVFVNPTQFNNQKDLETYPRTLAEDCRLLEQMQTDYLFLPDYTQMYPDNYRYHVYETELSKILCGAKRPGHFEGVLTVVLKLLAIIGPDRAYFGEKDYQQYLLIQGMAKAFFLRTAIIACPIVREESGLALSSRNRLLSTKGRLKASEFHRILSSEEPVEVMITKLEGQGFIVDYVEEHFGRVFGAVFLEEVRLIDNVKR